MAITVFRFQSTFIEGSVKASEPREECTVAVKLHDGLRKCMTKLSLSQHKRWVKFSPRRFPIRSYMLPIIRHSHFKAPVKISASVQ